jgi:hypothetical protein
MFSDLRRHCNELPLTFIYHTIVPFPIVCVVSGGSATCFVLSNLTGLTSPKIANGPKIVSVLMLLASGCCVPQLFSPPLTDSRKHRWFGLSGVHPSRSFARRQLCSLASSSCSHPIAPCFYQSPTYCLRKLAQKPSDGSQSS